MLSNIVPTVPDGVGSQALEYIGCIFQYLILLVLIILIFKSELQIGPSD